MKWVIPAEGGCCKYKLKQTGLENCFLTKRFFGVKVYKKIRFLGYYVFKVRRDKASQVQEKCL